MKFVTIDCLLDSEIHRLADVNVVSAEFLDGTYRGLLIDFLDELNKRLGIRIALRTDSVPKTVENAIKKQVDGILFLHP